MNIKKFFILLLIFSYIGSSAQVMNVRKWRKTERDSLDYGMILYEEKSFLQALPLFEKILNNHSDEEFLKFTYAKCALNRSDKHADAYKYLTEVYEKNKKLPDMQYDMALAAHYNYKFEEAENYINQYEAKKLSPEAKLKADQLKRYIANAKVFYANPTAAKISNLGDSINTADDEYVPAITADESLMYFTYAGSKSLGGRQNATLQADSGGTFMEDIYMAHQHNNKFRKAISLDSLNTNAPDAAISVSNDGRVLFIYQDIGDGHGDIYKSDLIGEHFSKPKKLRGEINSYSWDGHCSLSPDGQTLYFSSERIDGLGGRDIYRASLSADSSWTHVVNLGDSVNTPYDDDAPFISADGLTLFFSSKGRSSMGGYDVFRTVMNPVDSSFKKSDNLGYPINSTADDIYFVMAANGINGYYSSGKKEGKGMKDIYKVEPNFTWEKPALYLVKGTIKNLEGPVTAKIKVEVLSNNNKIYNTFSANSKTGAYLLSLPGGATYRLTYSYKNLKPEVLDMDASAIKGYHEKTENIVLSVAPEPVLAAVTAIAANVTATVNQVAVKTNTSTLALVAKTTASETTRIAKVEPKQVEKELKAAEPLAKVEAVKTETKTAVIAEVPVAKVEPVKTETKAAVVEEVAVAKVEPVKTEIKTPEPEKAKVVKTEPVKETLAVTEKPVFKPEEAKPLAEAKVRKSKEKNPLAAAWDFTAQPVSSTPLKLPKVAASKDGFTPINGPQVKTQKFAEKYGNVADQDVVYWVQVAAIKTDKPIELAHSKKLGKVEKIDLSDGYIRVTVGGTFKTLGAAYKHTKKVVKAGQKDSFVIALYKGRRVSFEELEEMGLLK